jgi:hypothetical protein
VSGSDAQLAEILGRQIFIRGANRPFAQLTGDDASMRAQELRAAIGWGPTARVAPVARAWSELAAALRHEGARTVAELPTQLLLELAPRLWVVLPDTHASGAR